VKINNISIICSFLAGDQSDDGVWSTTLQRSTDMIIESFEFHLRARNLSPRTIKATVVLLASASDVSSAYLDWQ
jgi:hypothetical protein